MTAKVVSERYGQETASGRLDGMARGIAAAIGDGKPATWSGFAWYRPQGLFQQNLIHRARRPIQSKAA
jgi:hypothetical protein